MLHSKDNSPKVVVIDHDTSQEPKWRYLPSYTSYKQMQ